MFPMLSLHFPSDPFLCLLWGPYADGVGWVNAAVLWSLVAALLQAQVLAEQGAGRVCGLSLKRQEHKGSSLVVSWPMAPCLRQPHPSSSSLSCVP